MEQLCEGVPCKMSGVLQENKI